MEENKNKNEEEKDNKNQKVIRLKIIALGESTVGKSCFILQYTQNIFQEIFISTIGVEYHSKFLEIDNKKYRIDFFDTAGQERYNSISSNSIKRAHGALLMYDITNKKSFEKISEWMKSIMEYKDETFPIILIGNKCDLKERRQVSEEEGKQKANNYKIDFMETSVKENINVDKAALAIINKVIEEQKDKLKKPDFSDTIELKKMKEKEKKKCKC